MEDFITARRKDDVMISVCQDNKKKVVLILGLNQAARNLLKYRKESLLNKPLINILSARAANDVNNYLEYTEDGQDLFNILPKVIGFSLIGAKGEDIRTRVKVFRTMQFIDNKINYEMLIHDISLLHISGMFRDEYLMGKKYKNHNLFDIPDSKSSVLELCVVSNFPLRHQINVVMGVIGFNCDEINDALKVVIEYFHKKCRSDDFLRYIGESKNCSLSYLTVMQKTHLK
ncbi:hypothetical protein [Wolbachia endosymbiont of Atemnus politus]|uniref:hypothetical protein n=1 Tax=Wolbachia endosymbiont of Atemnus politus TaxID=2682840 RepID=UPI001FE93E0E|nr:hypothetical protein [Wolbachia endosymbiont of Atemnus politus]